MDPPTQLKRVHLQEKEKTIQSGRPKTSPYCHPAAGSSATNKLPGLGPLILARLTYKLLVTWLDDLQLYPNEIMSRLARCESVQGCIRCFIRCVYLL